MKYRVSFSGWAYVEADSAEEAEEKSCMKTALSLKRQGVLQSMK